jgi:N6-L-threonylcarbamoyladenine synthase
MELIGATQDDAAGEAYDKSAKMLGLPYPGGPLMDQQAKNGNPHRFEFPFPAIPKYGFSFSGLKTSILYFLQKETAMNPRFIEENLEDLCASIQYRINSILISKLTKAAKDFKMNEIAIAGGVSANSGLRQMLQEAGEKHGWNTYIPAFEYCTDNAGMIAITAYYKFLRKEFSHQGVEPDVRMDI